MIRRCIMLKSFLQVLAFITLVASFLVLMALAFGFFIWIVQTSVRP